MNFRLRQQFASAKFRMTLFTIGAVALVYSQTAFTPAQSQPVKDKLSMTTVVTEKMQPDYKIITLPALEPGKTSRETVTIDGKKRVYFLHLSARYDAKKPVPLMLFFNGWGDVPGQGNTKPGAEGTEQFTGMSEKADSENFVVGYMDGYERKARSWNNGQWCFSKLDDMKFTNRVLEALMDKLNIDPQRVYLTGYSQGASFAHLFATRFPEKVAAVASVGGWLTGKEKQPSQPYSLIEMHCEADKTVPILGRSWWVTMKPQKTLKEFYYKANHFDARPETTTRNAENGTVIKEELSRNTKNHTEFRYITLQDAGHKWFGGKGAEGSAMNATDTIWNFLKDKRKSP